MTVCRGMMPSPLLFNLVLIQVLRNISPDVDFRVGDATVHVLAFADDVLVSSTIFGLQGNLQVLGAELHRAGLLLHPDKFCAVSLTIKVPSLRISRAPLKPQQCMHLVRTFRTYLLPKYSHAWTGAALKALRPESDPPT